MVFLSYRARPAKVRPNGRERGAILMLTALFMFPLILMTAYIYQNGLRQLAYHEAYILADTIALSTVRVLQTDHWAETGELRLAHTVNLNSENPHLNVPMTAPQAAVEHLDAIAAANPLLNSWKPDFVAEIGSEDFVEVWNPSQPGLVELHLTVHLKEVPSPFNFLIGGPATMEVKATSEAVAAAVF